MSSPVSFVPLTEVAEINPSLPVLPTENEEVAFVPMSAVNEASTDVTEDETRPFAEVRRGYTPFIRDDVLVAKITPCFENGKIALASLRRSIGFGSTEFHVIRARRDVLEPRYLAHFLRQERIRTEGQRRMTGSGGQRRVPAHFVASLTIPLPPLSKQQRIAAILDQTDALRAKRRAALAHLDALAQSIFLDMFGDPAANPRGWPVQALGDLAETMSGGTPKRDVDAYYGGGIPWVKSGELRQGLIVQTEESLTSRGLAESSAKLLPVGTVLVAMYGATVGAVSVLGVEAATNQAVCCIRPTPALQTTYLAALLRAMASSLIAKRVGGAQPNLSQELIRGLRIPVPPADEQAAFHECARNLGELAARHGEAQDLTEALFGSLQCRAFTGAL